MERPAIIARGTLRTVSQEGMPDCALEVEEVSLNARELIGETVAVAPAASFKWIEDLGHVSVPGYARLDGRRVTIEGVLSERLTPDGLQPLVLVTGVTE